MMIDGLTARTTKRGYRVVELDYWADPARDASWLERARQSSTSPAEFQRNILRNWSITGGAAFFPEFAEIGREAYLYQFAHLLNLPVIRGWDFGWRAPSVTWFQYSPKSDRVYVLREFNPRGISAHHFRDVVRYLSGQLELHDLDSVGHSWVEMLQSFPGVPTPPWFPANTLFEDFSGPEINAVQSISSKDPAEATVRQVFASGGIEFAVQTGRVKGRAMVLRRLLHRRPVVLDALGRPRPGLDGHPGIFIDPACTDVLAMLDGGLSFRKPTKSQPLPEEPRKDGQHDNVFDGLTYGLVGVVPPDGVPGVTLPQISGENVDGGIGWTV